MLAQTGGTHDHFGDAISALIAANPRPFFVQIGGFDGESFDPLRRHIVEKNLSGLIVEPVPDYFEKLKTLYAGSSNVTTVNCAVAEENGERPIWRFNPKAIERGLLPPHFAGIISFVMEDLLKETGVIGLSSPDAETTEVLRSQLRSVPVQCRKLDGLFADHGVAGVDILQIDTEGYDFEILKLFDFARYHPAIVHYEHQHLNAKDREAAEALLRSHGYRLRRNTYDTLAVQGLSQDEDRLQLAGLRKLAASLAAVGRRKEALLLLEHLEAVQSGDIETLYQLVRVHGAEGQTLKVLDMLASLRSVSTDSKPLIAEIKAQTPDAIGKYNDLLAAGDYAEAEKYIAGLAAIVPGNAAVLNSALVCNLALGRRDEAERYAAAILIVDRTHAGALALLTEHRV